MSKCVGCGACLQDINESDIGYTSNINNELCERCFRIRNYNDYKFVIKNNEDYINILKNVNITKDLVVLVVDLFNISKDLNQISEYVDNDILLVLTKRDILPKSCYDENFIKYFDNYNLNIKDTVVVSSNKNYNFDLLFDKINKYKKSNNVYVVGFTNSGKSTLINKILYNYSNNSTIITTSNLPSTTIDSIVVKVNDDLVLIDTPGLLDIGDISNFVDGKTLKKIVPQKEIKPITYQVQDNQTIYIDDLVSINLIGKTSATIYASNKLNIKRNYKEIKDSSNIVELNIDDNCDLVIQGLGFIKFTKKIKVKVYAKKDISIFVRKNLI